MKEELQKFIINCNQTIRQAMVAINENWREIVFVEDDHGRIIGTITDGDVRRGLLSGLTFESRADEVMKRNFKYVSPDVDRAAVMDIMKANAIRQIPVVDESNRLIGIHFLQEMLGTSVKPNVAVIMAGGMGMRLRPLTENCPKPMIRVAGRPILERIVLHLVGYGIRKIYISVNYLGKMIEDYFGDGSAFGCSIEYLREKKPLGTGGSLTLISEEPKHPILVMNGDQVTQVDIGKLLEFHENGAFEATIGARSYQVEIPFGVIQQKGGTLIELQEKPITDYLINAGIYVINPGVLRMIPRNEDFPITSLFNILMDKKMDVGVHLIEEDWIDVGMHDDLKRAKGII